MIEELDHIGIIVPDLNEAVARYQQVLGVSQVVWEDYGESLLALAFLPLSPGGSAGSGPQIELIEPRRPGSAAWDFLETVGSGVEHLAFRVPNLTETLARCQALGISLRDETPRPGSGGTRIAFVDKSATPGCLIEFVEGLRMAEGPSR
jgi:methylmalonyl-CoA/ethylmalonyl-CoA epimerase